MIPALSTTTNRRRSLLLLFTALVSGIAAAIIGISDNPPGIALAFLATIALVLVVAHPWRRSTQFRLLLYWSFGALLTFGVLHGVLEALAHSMVAGVFTTVVEYVAVTAFLVAILLCPPGLVVGAVGAIVTAIWPPKTTPSGTVA